MSDKDDKKQTKDEKGSNIDNFLLSLKSPDLRKKIEKVITDNLDTELINEISLRKIGMAVLENIDAVKGSITETADNVEKTVQRNRTVRSARVATKKTQRIIEKARKRISDRVKK